MSQTSLGTLVLKLEAVTAGFDRKMVGVNHAEEAVAATTYYVFIDLDGASYKHNTSGTAVIMGAVAGKGIPSIEYGARGAKIA